jgi:chromosome segregation ATPase
MAFFTQNYNNQHKKSLTDVDFEIPEPEQCPKPHDSSRNLLSVPISSTPDSSFRSLSSRLEHSKRSASGRRQGNHSKRSVELTKSSNSPYASPRTVAQDMERILIVEQQIKVEKEKYKKLEKKYKQLMTTQSFTQNKFESMIQELQRKIEEKRSGKLDLNSITENIYVIKKQISSLEERIDTFYDYINYK